MSQRHAHRCHQRPWSVQLARAAEGFAALWQGDIRGKIVLVP
jgi:hypothetical protein